MPSYFYGSLNVAVKLQVTSPKPAGTIFQARHLRHFIILIDRKHGNEMDRKRSTFESDNVHECCIIYLEGQFGKLQHPTWDACNPW